MPDHVQHLRLLDPAEVRGQISVPGILSHRTCDLLQGEFRLLPRGGTIPSRGIRCGRGGGGPPAFRTLTLVKAASSYS